VSTLLLVAAASCAIAAALRSTWSPCGLSMLSKITPMAEPTRNYTYRGTVAWFVVGATVGGATLGIPVALAAGGIGALDLAPEVALGLAGLAAAVTAASDAQLGGFRLPGHRRQVDDTWLDTYRSWVYGGGFGWQIGVGLATFIVTAAVYLTIVLAALTGSPAAAFGICVLFGLTRGLAVLISRSVTSPDRLAHLHRRFEQLAPVSRQLTIGFQVVLAVVALAAALEAPALLVLGLGAGVVAGGAALAAQRSASTSTAVSTRNSASSA
jgi:hypothetical protein